MHGNVPFSRGHGSDGEWAAEPPEGPRDPEGRGERALMSWFKEESASGAVCVLLWDTHF